MCVCDITCGSGSSCLGSCGCQFREFSGVGVLPLGVFVGSQLVVRFDWGLAFD